MANPVLSAATSGTRKVLLTWTYETNADFRIFWKSNKPAGHEYVLLATTNEFSYLTADLDPSKIYSFYVGANVGAMYFYSNVVELFVSCGKGVVLSADPPESPEAQGFLVVTDTGNHRIIELTRGLVWIASAGSSGSGNENYNTPSQSCIYGGYIYTADTGNHRIVKRKLSDLSYVGQSGSYGTGDGQFDSPEGVCSDGSFLYVADTGNSRIVKMTLSGMTFLSSFGHFNDVLHRVRIAESGGEHQGDPIAAGPDEVSYPGGIVPYDGPAVALTRGTEFAPGVWHRAVFFGSEGGGYANNVAKQYGPSADGPWTTYQIYGAAAWAGARGVVDAELGGYIYADVSIPDPIKAIHLSSPKGISSDGSFLFIADHGNNRILKVDLSDYTFEAHRGNSMGVASSYSSGFDDLSSVCLYFGNMFVCYEFNETFPFIDKYLSAGELDAVDSSIRSHSADPGGLMMPAGIWAMKGSLYTTERSNHRVQRFSITDYSYIAHLGGAGAGSGVNQFNAPRGITGNLWTP